MRDVSDIQERHDREWRAGYRGQVDRDRGALLDAIRERDEEITRLRAALADSEPLGPGKR